MAHDCPDCDELCYCDMDDTFMEENMNCKHWELYGCDRDVLDPEDDDDYFYATEN